MNKKIEIEINNNIGDFILPHLRNAKRNIYIVSPWVSPSHIDLLIDKKSSGVDIKIITTNDYSNNSGALEKLLERDSRVVREERAHIKYLGVSLFVVGFVLLVLPFFVKVKILSFLLIIPGAILYYLGKERRELFWVSKIGEENLTVFAYNSFHLVHAKVYVLDDLVIAGSANFTKIVLNTVLKALYSWKMKK